MKVNTNTVLIGLLGLAVVGGGAYLLMRDRGAPSGTEEERAMHGAEELADAQGVTNPSQFQAIYQMMLETMKSTKGASGLDKKLAEQQLIGGYLDMGLKGAESIASIVGTFI